MSIHPFETIPRHGATGRLPAGFDGDPLQECLARFVISPFTRASRLSAVAVPFGVGGSDDAQEPPPNPGHPACAEFSATDYCRESWQLHLAELKLRGQSHWHRCAFGVYCALTPVVFRKRVFAVLKVCCGGTVDEDEFRSQIEFLQFLVDAFVQAHTELLDEVLRSEESTAKPRHSPHGSDTDSAPPSDVSDLVAKAVAYLEAHLQDSGLTVKRIAEAVNCNPKYLSGVFRRERGVGIGEFIATRRITLAKDLLRSADWQIKRIAYACGFANPNWFSFVFRTQTGVTPCAFRRGTPRQPS